ncbi:MAG: UxaA family hydrolase [Limisphaerales bacterium]|jgi:altronate hydrolase|nr:altronate dehydratase [Verrucomicrobiota bacterium]
MNLSFDEVLLRLHPDDHVAVLKKTLKSGVVIEQGSQIWRLSRTIPAGHKLALKPIDSGQPLVKYGQIIGFALKDIQPGDHVHTHNLGMGPLGMDYRFGENHRPVDLFPPEQQLTFQGYDRGAGRRSGTRNYLAIISSVNCSASVSRYIAAPFNKEALMSRFPNVDGVVALTHKSGCSLMPDEPLEVLQRVLAGMAVHPNISGYLLVGLGCEVNQIPQLIQRHGLKDLLHSGQDPFHMNIQSLGGIAKTVDAGIKAVEAMLPKLNELRRTPRPLSELALAMNCGGSDGNSGITANPALGVASDLLVRHGGTSVLAETSEIYGAEHLLTQRACSREVGEQLVDLIRWWEQYTASFGATIDNNPSYGNKEGGLTTIYEKSLGAIAKAGQSPLQAVYRYAERIKEKGLCFMDTPGNDPVSMTGLVAGGCNLGVFTTGRGSVFGCKPVPCIKVATHTPLYQWMEDDMDVNAGSILEGHESVAQVGHRLFDQMIRVASGEATKSEAQGMGDEEFAPWMLGPTL